MSPEHATWSWDQARLHVLVELERLDREIRDAGDRIAIVCDKIEGKQKRDIDEAHNRIRALQSSARSLEGSRKVARIKHWATSACASFLALLVVELVKFILKNPH